MADIIKLNTDTKTEPDPLLIKEIAELLANVKEGKVDSAAIVSVVPIRDGCDMGPGLSICWGGLSIDLVAPVQVLLKDLIEDVHEHHVIT
jgi:hypothetical protein